MNSRHYALAALLTALIVHSVAAQSQWPTKAWPSSTPRALGLDPKVIAAFGADIAAGKYGYVDSMLVIRHGQVAYERMYKHNYDRIYAQEARTPGPLNAHDPSGPYNYFNPWWHPFYRRGDLHSMQSVTKTVTSVAIGIAIGRHEFPALDTPVLTFFEVAKVANVDGFKWWLYPYSKGGTGVAFGGSGLGGQRPIVLPEFDLIIVFTGWNVLPDTPNLTPRIAIDRVLEAVVHNRSGALP
jgi:CubicO group peptidase (beta-lactamase class C family)